MSPLAKTLALTTVALIPTGLVDAQTARPQFRDLNHNGKLDPYEDVRLPTKQRVSDLMARMTVEEKLGLMVHGTLPAVDSPFGLSSSGYDLPAIEKLIVAGKANSFITRLTLPPSQLADANNAVQRIAEQSRLGIPVTISTDPRNHFQAVAGASSNASGFSQWPEMLGFAATGDPNLVRTFGQIVAAEYRSVGIHMALSPQADLLTEPRWPRANATFGSDPATVSALAGAYVEGFQGANGVGPRSVATVAKHWVGYGAEPQGWDGHNQYGREVRLDKESFTLHVAAFAGVLKAKTAGIMPTYPIVQGVEVDGKPLEPVGAAFNRQLVQKLLREKEGYQGLVVSDWAVTFDCPKVCVEPTASNPQAPTAIGMPWGVETLSQQQRFAKGVEAGIDQFGGVDDPALLAAALKDGEISLARVDESARRVLELKFALGLFDNPYVDPRVAAATVGAQALVRAAQKAQSESQVLLENRKNLIPLRRGVRIWLEGVDPRAAQAAGFNVVNDLADAQVALVRTWGPVRECSKTYALMTAICVTRRVYASAGLWASGEFGMAGVPRAPDRRRLITLSSAD
ncbi:glycoside hydrolase family 3 protein [Sphingobium yanoikuyae]|uniref:beta-glucosidase n=2 Tax=Sphingobium yanoikuyae TaxID=13690 RepID=A0A430BE14_SPHYA|nr:glycoside hydrolase family 3 protein [Sphingobium yanoikuyae]